MPVKRREIVVRGKRERGGGATNSTILSCIQKRSLPLSRTDADGRWKQAPACTPLPVSYIIRPPFLPLFTTQRPLQSLVSASPPLPPSHDSTRFQPPLPTPGARERVGIVVSPGDNGSHQASGINYARLSPREKLRAGPEIRACRARRRRVVGEKYSAR